MIHLKRKFVDMHRDKVIKRALTLMAVLLFSSQTIAENSIRSIRIEFPGSTTLDSAVSIDVLFVSEQAIADQLPFEQFAWFSGKQEIIARYATNMTVLSAELLPGSEENLVIPQDAAGAVAVLVYASHEDPVAESIDITEEQDVLLLVEDWGIDVRQDN